MEIKEIKEFMTWCQQGPSINEKCRKMRIDKVNFIVTTTKAMGYNCPIAYSFIMHFFSKFQSISTNHKYVNSQNQFRILYFHS